MFLDEGFAVHLIIFDASTSNLPRGSFSNLHFKRPKSSFCAKISKCFKNQNYANFQNLLKGGIIDFSLIGHENCLITTLSFGVFCLENRCDIRFSLKKMFKDFHLNLREFCESILGKNLIKKLNSTDSLDQALTMFCKQTDLGIIVYNFSGTFAKIISRKNVRLKKLPIYILYDETENHVAYLFDLSIR